MITVLRLSHRLGRDKRISTHAGLVSRAFGADKIIFTGDHDSNLFNSLKNVAHDWGGSFKIEYSKNYKKTIMEYKNKGYTIIHLTMYGLPVQKQINNIKGKNILIIIGGEKVPPDVYELADHNISVTNQPHSEIAALAIILHYLKDGKELTTSYSNAKKKITPSSKGKNIKK